MKKMIFLLACIGFTALKVSAQVTGDVSNRPITHIQTSNEMYQNHSQFTNKDNKFDNSRPYLTGNGTYWVPGYSNPANRDNNTRNGLAPNTSVNPIQTDPVNTYIQENLRTGQNTIIIPRNVINGSYSDRNNQ